MQNHSRWVLSILRMTQFRFGYTNMLVSKNVKICFTPNAKPKICVTPNANPQCKQVEYSPRWSPGVGACIGHVHFRFFVLISFALGSQLEPLFQWNMGLSVQVHGPIMQQLMRSGTDCTPCALPAEGDPSSVVLMRALVTAPLALKV